MSTSRAARPAGGKVEPARVAARASRALADELLALPADEVADAVVARSTEAIALLLGADWARLGEVVRRDDTSVPAGYAWVASYALHHLGHLGQAQDVAARADTAGADEADRARLAAAEAATAWTRGEEDRAHERVRTAMKLARSCGDDGAEATAWVAQALLSVMAGDRDDNLRCYLRALELAEGAGDLLTQERVLNNLTSRAIEEGSYAEAVERAHQALAINDRTGHLSGTAVLRHNLAEALFGLGRLDESLVEAEAARALWEAVEAPSVGVSWQLLGDIQAARGNAAQAALTYAASADLAEEEQDTQTLAAALGGLAMARVADSLDDALALVERMLAVPAALGESLSLVRAGWVHLHAGDRATARDLAARAGAAATRQRDLPGLADALELAVLAEEQPAPDARLVEAGRIWREVGSSRRLAVHELVDAHLRRDALAEQVAREELQALGVHLDAWRIAGPLAAVGTARRTPVTVHALGGFVLYRDDQPVPLADWPSRKARDVLKILAARGERGISRASLGALLWPDVDGVGNRLSVALSHLRAVLDPERAHGADHFVVADRDSVRLDLDHVGVDVAAFRAAARAALEAARAGRPRAVRLLETAAAMHTGEFCETDPWDEWSVEPREEVEELGRAVVAAVAAAYAESPQPADAVPWLARLVGLDPYDEPAYHQLVGILSRLGRYGEARRHHRTYVLRMAELDVPAASWEELARG